MKEKEYKEEIIRLENVLLEKEKIIQDMQDIIHLLNSQKYKKYNLVNIQKDYFKNPNNEAIYNALIVLLDELFKPMDLPVLESDEYKKIKEKKYNEIKILIKQLEEERDLNND